MLFESSDFEKLREQEQLAILIFLNLTNTDTSGKTSSSSIKYVSALSSIPQALLVHPEQSEGSCIMTSRVDSSLRSGLTMFYSRVDICFFMMESNLYLNLSTAESGKLFSLDAQFHQD